MNALFYAAMTGRLSSANLQATVEKDNARRVKIFTKMAELLLAVVMFLFGDLKFKDAAGKEISGAGFKELSTDAKLEAVLAGMQATNKGQLFRELVRPFLIGAAELLANLLSPDENLLALFMQPGTSSGMGSFGLPAAGASTSSSAPSAAPVRYTPHFNHYPPAGSVQGFNWDGQRYVGSPPAPGTPLYGQGAMAGWYYDWGQRAWMEPVRG